jgi:hypothetical protein
MRSERQIAASLYGDDAAGRAGGRDFARHFYRRVRDRVWRDVIDLDGASSELLGMVLEKMREAASDSDGFYRKQIVVSYTYILTDNAGRIIQPPHVQLRRLLCQCDARQQQ